MTEDVVLQAIQEGHKVMAATLEEIRRIGMRWRAERDEAVEIVTLLVETLPKSCACDGGYGDDGRGTVRCLPHRAERLLLSMGP